MVPTVPTSIPRPAYWAGWMILIGVMACAYSAPMAMIVHVWWSDPDHVHGFLVPVFALVLLWTRRKMLESFTPHGSWWGLAFLALSATMRWGSAYFYFRLIDPLSLVPCIAGIVLLVAGWRALRWAGPSILFLAFMVPAPDDFADLLRQPLQRLGTIIGTYALQTLGIPAVAQGNVILLTEGKLGVAEACSGLRMMMLFLAVCVGAVFLMNRAPWQNVVIVLSAAPIAVVANVVRIAVTGVLHETASPELAETVYHDLAGWFMMPLAVVLLWIEMAILSRLFVAMDDDSLSGAPML